MIEQLWRNLPPVVKNLLLINLLMFAAMVIYGMQGQDLNAELGLYNFKSSEFRPYQIITHMFMHGSFFHIFFNMFALVMFGALLERIWGPKRFLFFYLFTGLGSMILYSATQYYEYTELVARMSAEEVEFVTHSGMDFIKEHGGYPGGDIGKLMMNQYVPMVGASGAIYGLLVAFGLLFPNTEMMLIFFPVPIKAKYFIPILLVMEYFAGVSNIQGDSIAHFAHLGGALFGFILVRIWNKNRNKFY